ncbi:MAG TPA: inositol monophosphatase family protein [Candidatus Acidoferrales bacterium]|jgi:myo-inositol-1(or 4)-monophosphatase|nr:inositol monophosphatase family protein [Candidatus Acidoferrales bacterium]
MREFLEVAREAAREAGSILLAEFDRPQRIGYKGEVDLVTDADRRSEEAIVARLRSSFPKHAILAEESGGHDSAVGGAASRYCWYVDPLDGTTNFAHGYPCFAISIGLSEGDDLLVGVVYNPISGELFTAAKDEGAFLDHKKIQVSTVESLATSLLATGFPSVKRAKNPNMHYYWDFTLRSHGVRRDGSAALDLTALACGRFDGFWEFGLKPWDTAAGVLLVREAGGTATDFAGRPYKLGGPELLASNRRIHTEMQQVAADIAERTRQSSP